MEYIIIKFCFHINIDKILPKELLNATFLDRGNAEAIMWQLAKIPITFETLGILWLITFGTQIDTNKI